MNDKENPTPERLIAAARELSGEHTQHDTSRHFPSYLRRFGTFFELSILESLWGAVPFLPCCLGRFSTAKGHVAFL
jgi:hypothetical protein